MNWETILAAAWSALNSPAGIAAAAGLMLWLLNRLYAARPAWRSYEGTIISAVKLAEKQIPDSTPSAGLARLDAALRLVLAAYEQANGRRASPQVAADLKEGIQLTHARLEAEGAL
ncbi:MAG: hypothetical protein FJ288_16390 [Planctomycetes bacterium]|nr:hypothetical protein [Planctomycetota bacterium]